MFELIFVTCGYLFQLYLRANFDYYPRDDKFIPTIEVGLEFKKGDILKILSQDETHWWQVRTPLICSLTM